MRRVGGKQRRAVANKQTENTLSEERKQKGYDDTRIIGRPRLVLLCLLSEAAGSWYIS